MEGVEAQIAEWRAYVAKAPAVDGRDVDELEGHLRDQIAELDAAGLAADEAFLDRREADGRPRRPVAGVRPRAQRPAVEAARPERRRRTGAPVRRWPEALGFAAGGGRRGPGRPPRRPLPRRGAALAAAQRRPAGAAVPRRLLRPPPAARRPAMAAHGRAVRARRARGQPLPVPPRTRPPSSSSRSTCPSCCGSRSPTRTWAARSDPTSGAWTSSASPASGSSTSSSSRSVAACCSALTAAILEPIGVDIDRVARVGAAVGRGRCRGRGGVARGVQAAGRGEHGAGAHHALHPAVRRDADRRRGHLRRVRSSPVRSTASCSASSTRCWWSCSGSSSTRCPPGSRPGRPG